MLKGGIYQLGNRKIKVGKRIKNTNLWRQYEFKRGKWREIAPAYSNEKNEFSPVRNAVNEATKAGYGGVMVEGQTATKLPGSNDWQIIDTTQAARFSWFANK